MAENVNIVGIDDLPDWATEKTQQAILKHLMTMTKLTTQQTKEINKSFTGQGKGGKMNMGDFRRTKRTLTKSLKDVSHSALHTAAGLHRLPGPLKAFEHHLRESSTGFKGAMAGLGLFATAIGASMKIVQHSVTIFKSLADSGVTFNQSIVKVQGVLADTGMTLDQFKDIAEKYANVLSTNGIQALTLFVKRTRAVTGGFQKFGLTTADATQYAAEYLEQQRMAGVFRQAADKRQARALSENIERLTSYSKVLNISRKQMQEATDEAMKRDDVQSMFFGMSIKQRKKAIAAFRETSQAMSSLGAPGKKLLSMFSELAASPIAENSEAFKELASVAPNFAQEVVRMSANMKKGIGVSQNEILTAVSRASANTDLLKAMRLAGGQYKSVAELLSELGMASQNAKATNEELAKKAKVAGKSIGEYKKRVDKNTQAATKLDDSMKRIKATMEYTMIKGFAALIGGKGRDAVNALANGLNKLSGKMRAFADGPMTDLAKKMNQMLVAKHGLAGLAIGLGTVATASSAAGAALATLPSLLAKSVRGVAGLARGGGAAGMLGKTGLVAGAGYAGWEAGSWFYHHNQNKSWMLKFSDMLGETIDTVRASLGDKEAQKRVESMAMASTASAQTVYHHTAPVKGPKSTASPAAAQGRASVVDTRKVESLLHEIHVEVKKMRRNQTASNQMQ